MIQRLVLAVLIAVAAGCASSGQGAPARNSEIITKPEIEASGASNAYEAVERLRPGFFRPRGAVIATRRGAPAGERIDGGDPSAGSLPTVVLDGIELGGIEELRNIPASSVFEIRYSSNRDELAKLGSGQYGGVIFVRTR